MIAFSCSHCGLKFQVKPEFAGRSSHCPTCKQPLVVPSSGQAQAEAPAGVIEGTTSSLVRSGLAGGVSLAQAAPAGRADAASVQELLARRAPKDVRYLLAGEIARGGMGMVVRAVDCDIRREVAVKYLLDQQDAGKKLRFIEEAQITGQLEHPNIVPIHELGVDALQRLFFTMKMVRGRSLAQVLAGLRENPEAAEKEYPLARLLTVLTSVCNALAYAHSRSVVHRDLKPANIMLGDFGEVYVMDWGLAKVRANAGGEAAAPTATLVPGAAVPAPPAIPLSGSGGTTAPGSNMVATSRAAETDLTREGAVLGTPVYMAPEQASGNVQAVDHRSDVYALGAILYEILTLQPPVDRDDGYLAILLRVMQGEIMPPEQRAPQRARGGKIPRELSAIARKALARDPGDRYPSAESFRRDVERFQEGRSVSAKTDTTWEVLVKFVKRNRAVSAATFVGVVLVGIVLAAFLREQARRTGQAREAVPAFVRAARLLVNEGAFADALAQVNLALAYEADRAEARLLRGELLIVQQQFPAARADLEQYVQARPDDAAARTLVALCKQARPDDHATQLAFAAAFAEQKAFHLADAMVRQFAPNTAEARQQLLLLYRKRIDAAWPGLGNSLSMDPAGKYTLILREYRQVGDLTPLKGMPLTVLDLAKCPQVRDLTPLAGMPLVRLNLNNCVQVQDLSPLRGMPLTALGLNGCSQVRDLAPLHGMPLQSLTLESLGQLRDLSPLKGMPLTALSLEDCGQVQDLAPLRGMKLGSLSLWGCRQVADLAPLRGMRLTALDLHGCAQVRDLAPLRGMKLATLDLARCGQVRDLTPLRDLPVTALILDDCVEVKDLSPLAGMKLAYLSLNGCGQIPDLTPVRGLPLTTLDLRGCGQVADLRVFQGMNLNTLMLANCRRVRDLTALRGLPLTTLDLRNCGEVQDLTPLQGMKLTALMLDNCGQVRDLTPLQGMPLSSITLWGCAQVRDLTPLQGMSLTEITLSPTNLPKGLEVLRQMKTLKQVGTGYDRRDFLPAVDFWKKVDAGEWK